MNIVKSKYRIINYLDYKGISKPLFFSQTGIKRGFLDSDKLNQNISEEHIAKIIATYKDVNLQWLITGEGEMLKESNSITNTSTPKVSVLSNEKDERIKELKDMIALQKERIKDLEERLNEAMAQLGGGGQDVAGDAGCAAVG